MTRDLDTLRRRQLAGLRLDGRRRLRSPRDAERFLGAVGVALRYQATSTLPLASLRSAVGPESDETTLVTSVALTNHLLASNIGIEVSVVAGRLAIVHHTMMPALHRLVRRGRGSDELAGIGDDARRALALIRKEGRAIAGEVRQELRVSGTSRPDRADTALSELQRWLLVDRGPFVAPKSGIAYLAPEGYPYRIFDAAHADLVNAAATLTDEAALDRWLTAYLGASVFASARKLASLFRVFTSPPEIAGALSRLADAGRIEMCRVGRETLAVSTAARRA